MMVGWIGLGEMGRRMAENLHDAGVLSRVYNRTQEKAQSFGHRGVDVADTPKACARGCDVVVTMVTDDEALVNVSMGEGGLIKGLAQDAVVLQMSTVSVDATMHLVEAVHEAGATMVDAPVSGTIGPAEQGTLTILAGGEPDDLETVGPILKVIGDPVKHCGGVGDGTRTKLFTNMLLGAQMQALAEALVFGSAQGLSLEHMKDVVSNSPVGAPLFDYKFPVLENRDFQKQFPVGLLLKDLDLAQHEAENAGVYLPQLAATREAVQGANALGYADDDMAGIVKLLETVSGQVVGEDD